MENKCENCRTKQLLDVVMNCVRGRCPFCIHDCVPGAEDICDECLKSGNKRIHWKLDEETWR